MAGKITLGESKELIATLYKCAWSCPGRGGVLKTPNTWWLCGSAGLTANGRAFGLHVTASGLSW